MILDFRDARDINKLNLLFKNTHHIVNSVPQQNLLHHALNVQVRSNRTSELPGLIVFSTTVIVGPCIVLSIAYSSLVLTTGSGAALPRPSCLKLAMNISQLVPYTCLQ